MMTKTENMQNTIERARSEYARLVRAEVLPYAEHAQHAAKLEAAEAEYLAAVRSVSDIRDASA